MRSISHRLVKMNRRPEKTVVSQKRLCSEEVLKFFVRYDCNISRMERSRNSADGFFGKQKRCI